MLAAAALGHRLGLGALIVYASAAVGTSMIAFGGLNWALDGAAAPVAAVARLEAAMGRAGTVAPGPRPADRHASPPRSGSGTSRSPTRRRRTGPCCAGSTWRSRPAPRWPSSGRTAPARPRWPSCCAGCTTRSPASIEVDGVDLQGLDLDSWRRRVTAVFQDFVRFELTLRENVIPRQTAGAATEAGGADSSVHRQAVMTASSQPR